MPSGSIQKMYSSHCLLARFFSASSTHADAHHSAQWWDSDFNRLWFCSPFCGAWTLESHCAADLFLCAWCCCMLLLTFIAMGWPWLKQPRRPFCWNRDSTSRVWQNSNYDLSKGAYSHPYLLISRIFPELCCSGRFLFLIFSLCFLLEPKRISFGAQGQDQYFFVLQCFPWLYRQF